MPFVIEAGRYSEPIACEGADSGCRVQTKQPKLNTPQVFLINHYRGTTAEQESSEVASDGTLSLEYNAFRGPQLTVFDAGVQRCPIIPGLSERQVKQDVDVQNNKIKLLRIFLRICIQTAGNISSRLKDSTLSCGNLIPITKSATKFFSIFQFWLCSINTPDFLSLRQHASSCTLVHTPSIGIKSQFATGTSQFPQPRRSLT